MSVRVADSGSEVCTISVTGRMVGTGAVVLTVSMTGGLKEPIEGIRPESMHGGGVDEGEIVTGLGGVGEREGLSIIQGEVEFNFDGWESMTGGVGECLGEGVVADSSNNSNSMGMSESALKEGGGSEEMLQSGIGTGEGVGDGGRSSCIDGVRVSADMEWLCSSTGGSNFGVILWMSLGSGSGDSNVELGRGSMMGTVEINKEAGTV